MNTALRTIDSYPDDWIVIYTDRSAFKRTIKTGYGACLQFPDQMWTCEQLYVIKPKKLNMSYVSGCAC